MEGRGDEEEEEKGRGGKLTTRSLHRAPPNPTTPYDRPPRATSRRGGWLSRLIVQPAARLLPSIFSSDHSRIEQEDRDGDSVLDSDNQVSQSREPGPAAETDRSKVISEFCDGRRLAEIEQSLNQKMFSRDESNRLIEVVRSRTTGLSNDDGNVGGSIAETTEGELSQKVSISSATEKYAVKSEVLMTSDPLPLSKHSEVGSSPVDIAKSYMQSLPCASDPDGQIRRLVVEKRSYSDESASRLSFPSVVDSPMRWPGAVVQNNHGYFTPQTRIRRVGLSGVPCTPYSSSVFRKSDSKEMSSGFTCLRSQDGGERPSKPPLAGWKQTSIMLGGNTAIKRSSVLNDDFASVGSTWRAHANDLALTIEGAGPSNLGQKFLFSTGTSNVLKDFSSHFPGDLEHGSLKTGILKPQPADNDKRVSRFSIDSPTVHPQSSQVARRILKHLDRTLPSPREKLLELDIVTARRNAPLTAVPYMVDGGSSIRDAGAANNHSTGCLPNRNFNFQQNPETQKQPVNAESPQKDQLAFQPIETGMQGILGLENSSIDSKVFHITKSVRHSSGKRPVNTSISSSKTSEKPNTTTEFTFPVPLASNTLAEPPPTPTMASTVAAASQLPLNNEGTIPSFSFGSSNTNKDPVSFLEEHHQSSSADKSTPKVDFGSGKICDTSSRKVGKDAICY